MATAKAIKTSFFGLLSAALMSAPAFAQNATSVYQTSSQGAEQAGIGNVSAQGSLQSADVTQSGSPYGYPYGYPYGGHINGANVVQGNNQQATQIGVGNTNIQGNSSTATVNQGSPAFPWFPGHPSSGVNGANVIQGSNQDAFQFGGANTSVQGNAADATVIQR